ncbi:MAG: hypothetical protein GQ565_03820 [Candidatus Aegiribacteria sp.]|nr:hypothetical protein [Candidatus Aegiribacteria sp.]
MRVLSALIILLILFKPSNAEGDLRFRLQRRLPGCRGTLENHYTGDEFDFYSRLRCRSDLWRFILLMDKARGEEWVDIIAGGAAWTPGGYPVRSVSVGWLKADMGSGLVLSFPGKFSSLNELSLYKPPNPRNRIEPATSPWGCRGEPLTGIGIMLEVSGVDISVLTALSPIDSLVSGYHRNESEVLGRNAFIEKLAAVRISGQHWGVTAAAASRNETLEYDWFRCGSDWNIDLESLNLSGEAAVGLDSSGATVAAWGSFSQEFSQFRHMLTVLRNPAGYPSDRSSPPVSRECDIGICYCFRWKTFPRMLLKAGTGTYFNQNSSLLLASLEAEYRFPWSMQATAGIRTRTETDEGSWRSWLGSTWQPQNRLKIRTKIQVSGWSSSPEDSSESGVGIELKFRYSPRNWLTIDLGGAACSTDGYNSRVYAGSSSFPGVFGSTALYNRSFLLFFQASAEISEGFFLRGAMGRKIVEDADFLGSGWEETEGDSRTELGFQLDYAFQ